MFQVSFIVATDQSITVNIQYGTQTFTFSAIYGCNEGVDRRRLWRHLGNLHDSCLDVPWLLVGDFNITMDSSEF